MPLAISVMGKKNLTRPEIRSVAELRLAGRLANEKLPPEVSGAPGGHTQRLVSDLDGQSYLRQPFSSVSAFVGPSGA